MGVLSLPLWLRRENCAVAGEGAPIFVAGGGGLAAAADGFSVGWQKDGCHSHFWIKNGAVEWCAEQGLLCAAGEQARWPIAGNYFRAGTNGIIEVGCFSARPAGRALGATRPEPLRVSAFRVTIPRASPYGTARRGHSVPRAGFAVAMLTLLRVPF
jgi:hypothetical protein